MRFEMRRNSVFVKKMRYSIEKGREKGKDQWDETQFSSILILNEHCVSLMLP